MSSLSLLALSIAPGLALVVFIYYKDLHEREPLGLLLKCFLAGMFSVLPAIALETLAAFLGFEISNNSWHTLVYAFGVVGFSEEISKYFMIRRYAYSNKEFNEPFDGIVYSVMVGMGFATVENILYVYQAGFATGVWRMFTAVPAHATFAVLMGYFIGKAKFDGRHRWWWLLNGLGGAILFHGAYDYFLFEMNYSGIYLGAFFSLFVAVRLSLKAIREHQDNSPFKPTSS